MAINLDKYWHFGMPYAGLVSNGSIKYWHYGLPYGFIYEEVVVRGPLPLFRPVIN